MATPLAFESYSFFRGYYDDVGEQSMSVSSNCTRLLGALRLERLIINARAGESSRARASVYVQYSMCNIWKSAPPCQGG